MMKFEERRSKARLAVVEFLSGFAPPRGLSDEAMAKHVANVADAFARRMPVGDETRFNSDIEKTFTSIRDNHKGYAWPVQSEFVDAMPKGAAPSGAKLQQYKTDEKVAIAKRMNANEPVPEAWVWGQSSWPVVAGGMVSRDQMDAYRRASAGKFKVIYGPDAYGIMQAKYGDVVGAYFSDDAQHSGGAA